MHTGRIGLAFTLGLTFSAYSFAQTSIDLGFEAGRVGEAPQNWQVTTEGWKAELSDKRAAAGKRSLKLFMPDSSGFMTGILGQVNPAAAYAGRRVTLTAKLLVVGVGQGQMWLRVDRADGKMGAFDNMYNRPILAGGWQGATIEAEVDADAAALVIGFMMAGSGTLYIDDVKLRVSESVSAARAPSPAKPLSERGLQNMVAAAKLLSYVRFFHPSDQAVGVASWDHVAVALMQNCEPPSDAALLAKRLRATIAEIAPTVEVWAGTPDQAPPLGPVPEGARKAAMWQHLGAGTIGAPGQQQVYRSSVQKLALKSLPGGLDAAYVVKDLGGGVSCRIPVAVFVDAGGTLPHGKVPLAYASTAGLPKLTSMDRSTRLAGVALAWGVFQHFYPYFDVAKTDWEAALPAALAEAAEDADEREYLETLREMVAKLHDGHGRVFNLALQPQSYLPLAVEWAGDELVVTGKAEGVPDSIEVGDTILSIDRKPLKECYAEAAGRISAATEGWLRCRFAEVLIADYPTQDTVQFTLAKPNGRRLEIELARARKFTLSALRAQRPQNGAEFAPGLVYFDLNGAKTETLRQFMPQLEAAKAIIFDLRGYPDSAGQELMTHLIDKPATSAQWCIPIIRRPDREEVEWQKSAWDLQPAKPRLKAKIAFLADGRAISYAESVMGIVEHYKLGEIVGATTAGTNGNVNLLNLPGGYIVYWTGMKVLKHDGSQHHGVGIKPMVPVTPTAKGISEGRDEVLDKAIEVMKQKIAAGA